MLIIHLNLYVTPVTQHMNFCNLYFVFSGVYAEMLKNKPEFVLLVKHRANK